MPVRAAAVAVPGTVAGSRLVHAPGLSWHGVDLSGLWPHYEPGSEFVAEADLVLERMAQLGLVRGQDGLQAPPSRTVSPWSPVGSFVPAGCSSPGWWRRG